MLASSSRLPPLHYSEAAGVFDLETYAAQLEAASQAPPPPTIPDKTDEDNDNNNTNNDNNVFIENNNDVKDKSAGNSATTTSEKDAHFSPLRTLLRLHRRRYASSALAASGAASNGDSIGSGSAGVGGGGAGDYGSGVDSGGSKISNIAEGGVCWGGGAAASDSWQSCDAAERDGVGGAEGGGVIGMDAGSETWEPETRTILQMSCSIQRVQDDEDEEEEEGEDGARNDEGDGGGGGEKGELWSLTLLFRLSDKMNRQLTAIIGYGTAPFRI